LVKEKFNFDKELKKILDTKKIQEALTEKMIVDGKEVECVYGHKEEVLEHLRHEKEKEKNG